MAYTLGEAAKATGKSKPTLSKAIKAGRISALKLEDGSFHIDPSELHRVYPPVEVSSEPKGDETRGNPLGSHEETYRLRELELLLSAAKERLADKETQLADLREDRDRWRQQAQALLTDQRPKLGFWKRMFAKDA